MLLELAADCVLERMLRLINGVLLRVLLVTVFVRNNVDVSVIVVPVTPVALESVRVNDDDDDETTAMNGDARNNVSGREVCAPCELDGPAGRPEVRSMSRPEVGIPFRVLVTRPAENKVFVMVMVGETLERELKRSIKGAGSDGSAFWAPDV